MGHAQEIDLVGACLDPRLQGRLDFIANMAAVGEEFGDFGTAGDALRVVDEALLNPFLINGIGTRNTRYQQETGDQPLFGEETESVSHALAPGQ